FTGHLAIRYFVVSLAALLVFAWLAAQAFESSLSRSTWTEIEAAANLAASEAAPQLDAGNLSQASDAAQRVAQNTRIRITLVLPDGKVVQESKDESQRVENVGDRPEIVEALAGRRGQDTRFSDTRKEEIMFVAVPVRQAGKIVGAVRAGKSATEIQQIYRESARALLIDLIAVGIVAGLIGWWLARRTSRQLTPLFKGAGVVSQDQLIHKMQQ